MNLVDKYYCIAAKVDDDIYLSAFVIKKFCPSIAFSKVLRKVENLNLETLEEAINIAYKLDDNSIKKITREMSFANELQYSHYLQDLLTANNILFAPYRKTCEIEIEHKKQGALFEDF